MLIYLEELPWGIEVAFDDSLTIHESDMTWQAACDKSALCECRIKSSIPTLLELSDSRQITRLIREHKLDLDGDIHIAQRVSALFQELDIDWEEVLSQYLGDVAAHQVMKTLKAVKTRVKRQTDTFTDTLGSALIDEKKVAVHRLQAMHFSDQVNDLKDATERLSARLTRMEEL